MRERAEHLERTLEAAFHFQEVGVEAPGSAQLQIQIQPNPFQGIVQIQPSESAALADGTAEDQVRQLHLGLVAQVVYLEFPLEHTAFLGAIEGGLETALEIQAIRNIPQLEIGKRGLDGVRVQSPQPPGRRAAGLELTMRQGALHGLVF